MSTLTPQSLWYDQDHGHNYLIRVSRKIPVNKSGHLEPIQDCGITGKVNFRERNRRARHTLSKVSSPRSLNVVNTGLYTPQNNKFDGYT